MAANGAWPKANASTPRTRTSTRSKALIACCARPASRTPLAGPTSGVGSPYFWRPDLPGVLTPMRHGGAAGAAMLTRHAPRSRHGHHHAVDRAARSRRRANRQDERAAAAAGLGAHGGAASLDQHQQRDLCAVRRAHELLAVLSHR